MAHNHLLIVDDSKTRRALIARDFRLVDFQISEAGDGSEAMKQILKVQPDLILMDYEMPEFNGMEVIAWMKESGIDIPVILMTVHNSDELHARSLKLGCDDYLHLPVAFPVMLAHVEARLKKQRDTTEKFCFLDVEVDTCTCAVRRGSYLLELTPKEYRLLVTFLKHPRHMLTRDQILLQVWGHDFEGDVKIVDQYVRTLRRKLEAHDGKRLIYTKNGYGYILHEPETEKQESELVQIGGTQ
jgi:DNA-binding response OmpR family regulator